MPLRVQVCETAILIYRFEFSRTTGYCHWPIEAVKLSDDTHPPHLSGIRFLATTLPSHYDTEKYRCTIRLDLRAYLIMGDFLEVWRSRGSIMGKLAAMLQARDAAREQEINAATNIKRVYRGKVEQLASMVGVPRSACNGYGVGRT